MAPALYLGFEGADVICESAHVIFQLVDSGPLVVDSSVEFVDKSLQETQEQKCNLSGKFRCCVWRAEA